MKLTKLTALCTAAAAAAILAGCGGGGGGAPAPAPAPSPAPATNSSTGSTSTPTYAAGSPQATALAQLNMWRQACGFTAITQNPLLDQAAANHLSYMQKNAFIGHQETQGNPGFTGAMPADRASAVGYGSFAGEEISPHATDIGGALSIIGLASVPYHEAGIFSPYVDFGMAYGQVTLGPASSPYTTEITTGYQSAPATFANAPLTFPCQGVNGVDYENSSSENPTPTINGTPVQLPIGTPVTVVGNVTDTLRLTSGQMVSPQGATIALTVMDSSNDSQHELSNFSGVAFPPSPLAPNTTYSVSISGTVNGTPFTRNFSFTTGTQGQF